MRPSDLRVLVVDNHADYVAATTALLRAVFDCDVRGWTDGAGAAAAVEDFQPHLLLLDIAMPRADGFAVIDQLQTSDMMPPYVVAVSGFAGEAITARCLRAGFHRNVAKPVELECLHQLMVEALIRVAEDQQEHYIAPTPC